MSRFLALLLCFAVQMLSSQINLIPKPQKLLINDGFLKTGGNEIIVRGDIAKEEVSIVNSFILPSNRKLVLLNHGVPRNVFIILEKTSSQHKDFYRIDAKDSLIKIQFTNPDSKFYALQTLAQIINQSGESGKIPNFLIEDYPKYKWRGMHLDVCRHFFTKDEVKKYIDYLAMYKINTFHWHLTDDQGWRIEIKKYPKLTEIGAWRNGSMIGHYSEQRFDNKRYGGFYTQDEIREVVKYAADRHINIVPEIEMPGHAVAAIASYPFLGCTGKQIEVEKKWGVFEDIFCPKEETFTFLEDVLTEVMALFPTKTIHIGGDEAPKTRWKECAHCQALIKKEGLKDEHGLQSYFITRIEKFLNSKGRNIIGWDEILEGGLAPNAAVMSWRGTEGGIAAAKSGHYAVLTPGSPMYFDHYQGDPKNEPVGFGGFNPLEKVYQFNPLPKELASGEQKFIWGTQANLWTEYINDFKHVEYMLFPRLMALSEVAWGTSQPEKYNDFQQRVFENLKTLDKIGVNYSRSLYNLSSVSSVAKNGKDRLLFSIKGFQGDKNIFYTTDGSEPNAKSNVYKNPIPVNSDVTVKAAYFEDGVMKSKVLEQKFYVSKSTGQKITLKQQPDQRYFGIGAETLIDGLKGDPAKFGKDWLGFRSDAEATIELPQKTEVSNLKINFVSAVTSWIHLPKSIKIKFPETGKTYEVKAEEIKSTNGIVNFNFPKTSATKVVVEVENAGIIPDELDGAGNTSWLFIDEISLY